MRRLVWLIAAIAISTPCLAQNPPNIGIDVVTTTSPLRPDQKAALTAYVEGYIKNLQSKDAELASRARGNLTQPLTRPGSTALFRDEYSRVLLPLLTNVVEQQDNHFAAINAMQIAAQLRTGEALRLAMRHVAESDEPRAAVRVWAAIAFNETATPLSQNRVMAQQVDSATRDLARAAKSETDWLVLLRELQALGNLDTPVARKEERDVLSAVTDRMANQDGPSDLVHAVFPAVVGLRDRMLAQNVSTAALTAQGKDLAPILAKLFEVAEEHWDKAQEDQDAKSTYGSLVSITEATIKRIDTFVAPPQQRAPQTTLKESWEQANKPRFVADVKQWMDRVGSSIYKP